MTSTIMYAGQPAFNQSTKDDLFCSEVLDVSDLNRTPERGAAEAFPMVTYADQEEDLSFADKLPETVQAVTDPGQLNDTRVLQNLLRNEDKYIPPVADYVNTVQKGNILPEHRKLVADWMLGIIIERCCQPEVFCLAMNFMDRFLCHCQIKKSQLQLLGAVCILIASKIREPIPIQGKKLIIYTDYSISAQELKDWELLVLYKLGWELSSITPLDYLGQTILRLGLNEEEVDLFELRRRTETILVLAATDYQFAYHPPSLLAAASLMLAISRLSSGQEPPSSTELQQPSSSNDSMCSLNPITVTNILSNWHRGTKDVLREIKLRLQTVTHTATDHIDKCTEALNRVLPGYLKGISEQYTPEEVSPSYQPQPDSTCSPADRLGDVPHNFPVNLTCEEQLCPLEDSLGYPPSLASADAGGVSSRSSSPLSAVDIFSEYQTNVLQALFDQVDTGSGNANTPGSDKSHATILVSS